MRRILTDKKTRNACKIYAMLKKHLQKKHLSFHTPGHKNAEWDITELSFSDNLSSPRGCIAEAEKDIALALNANASFILTDGSTSGVLSMLFAAKSLGVKTVATLAPLHKSVYNGCALLELKTIEIPQTEWTLFVQNSQIDKLPSWLKKADALFLTSPDYYGNIPPLSTLKTLCERAKIPLLIDGAHGGHLHYTKNLHAGTYADMWVDGVHKSLPALTQGAIVSAKTEKYAVALRAAVDIFRTTSPSYPIMASVEYAVKYPKNECLERQVRAYASTSTRLQVNEDYTKLCALFGENAFAAHAYLESKGIYAEFCDGNVVCFYLSPATKVSDFKALQRLLNKAFTLFPYVEKASVQRIPAPQILDENVHCEWIDLANAVGRIAATNCGLFPPCTPLVFKGEEITKETVSLLQKADNVFGLWQNKISVIKNTKE